MAEARLQAVLAGDDPLVNVTPSHVTFRQACDGHVRHLEHDRQRKRSTNRDARSTIKVHLLAAFGADMSVEKVTTADVEALQERLLYGFYVALDTAGLGNLREQENPIVFHDLRHTFGTLAIRHPR